MKRKINSRHVYSDVNDEVIVFHARVRKALRIISGMYISIFISEVRGGSLPYLGAIEGEVVKIHLVFEPKK